jgi:hypothetical protein
VRSVRTRVAKTVISRSTVFAQRATGERRVFGDVDNRVDDGEHRARTARHRPSVGNVRRERRLGHHLPGLRSPIGQAIGSQGSECCNTRFSTSGIVAG